MRNRTIDCKHLPKIYQGEKRSYQCNTAAKAAAKTKRNVNHYFSIKSVFTLQKSIAKINMIKSGNCKS